MRKQKVLAKDFQFYFADLDNIILVECHEDETVTIRASRDNVPEQRKIYFIRKLAAEGFISDDYERFPGPPDGSNHVSWIKDYSWLKSHKPSGRRTNRIMRRLLLGGCILWIAMMRILLASNHNNSGANSLMEPMVAVANPSVASTTQTTSESLASRHPLTQLDK